jgi:hypothetical protein
MHLTQIHLLVYSLVALPNTSLPGPLELLLVLDHDTAYDFSIMNVLDSATEHET